MEINRLINILQQIREEHGNADVYFKQEDEYIGDEGYAITEIHHDIDILKEEIDNNSFVIATLRGG